MSSWKEYVQQHIPHGEEGTLNLSFEDAVILQKLLLRNGYAVCITGGDVADTCRVCWIYAGITGDLDWADYSQVCFTSIDYIEDYTGELTASQEENS